MKRVGSWLALAAPALVAVWAYGYSVGLPFFTDDAPHYSFLVGVESVPALWLGQAWSPYYRPVVYSLWRWGMNLQGGVYDPVTWHAFNVLLYAACGVLVALLVKRVLRTWAWGAVAGVLFVLFPLNYQAVNWVGSLSHLVVTFGVVLGVLTGLVAARRGGVLAYALCWFGALTATFTHENGLLVAPLLLVTLWLAGVRRWRTLARVALVPCVLAGLYALLWLTLPRPRLDEGLRLSSDLWQNAAVLLHGFAYPVSALLRPFVVGKADNTLVLGVVGVTTSVLLLLTWRARGALLWAYFWYVASVALSLLLLQPDYVYSSPRLLVLASVGAMTAWVLAWRALAARGRVGRVLAVAGVLWLVGLSVAFLQLREKDYKRMAAYAWELFALTERVNVHDEGLLLINAPNYIAPTLETKFFLTGEEFASFMTPEISYNDYLWVNTGVPMHNSPIQAVAYGELLQYSDGMFVPYYPMLDLTPLQELLNGARHIVVTQFVGNDFFPVYVAGAGQADAAAGALAVFGADDVLTLQAARYALVTPQRLRVRLQWQLDTFSEVKRFVHVLCDGQLVGQQDGYAWGNLAPFGFWQPHEARVEQLEIWTKAAVTPDCLRVLTGVYDARTGERLPARTPEGTLLPDGAWDISVAAVLP